LGGRTYFVSCAVGKVGSAKKKKGGKEKIKKITPNELRGLLIYHNERRGVKRSAK